jgi:hypothetical protein
LQAFAWFSSLCFFKWANSYRYDAAGTFMLLTSKGSFIISSKGFGVNSQYQVQPLSGAQVGEVLIIRSTYQVEPFYLSSETVLPIK